MAIGGEGMVRVQVGGREIWGPRRRRDRNSLAGRILVGGRIRVEADGCNPETSKVDRTRNTPAEEVLHTNRTDTDRSASVFLCKMPVPDIAEAVQKVKNEMEDKNKADRDRMKIYVHYRWSVHRLAGGRQESYFRYLNSLSS
jgi:hypothetical protein